MPRLIGIGKAKKLLFSGDSVSGEEAYRIGLVNKIAPKENLLAEAKAWAQKLADKTESSDDAPQAFHRPRYGYGPRLGPYL
jgi:enoyl-CoA hydratase/carnithine racemase